MEAQGQKRVLLSEAHRKENLDVAHYLLNKGHRLALLSNESGLVKEFMDCLEPEYRRNCFCEYLDNYTEEAGAEAFGRILDQLKGLDILINGLPGEADEAVHLESSPDIFGKEMASAFHRFFLLNRETARHMIRGKAGNIIFLQIDDVLTNAGYAVSPVQNHGRLAMMKSMAKELAPFHIKVNALTFGIYDRDFDPSEKREMRRKLEFCALKPQIPAWKELLPALDALIEPSYKYMTGQNYSACIGTSNT